MESVPPAIASTRKSTNYARLCRLLVDVGCTVLCDIFDSKNPPATMHKVLSRPYVHFILEPLKTVLNPVQWRELSQGVASNVSSVNFNAAVLMVLLRKICDFNPPVSTGNWDQLPLDSDNSTEANIVRIKCYRDEVYAYNSEASVDDPVFIALWQKISSAVLVLGYETSDSAFYKTVISELATAKDMDPAAEAHFIKLLSNWKKDDDMLKEVPEELKERTYDNVGEIIGKQQKTNNELEETKGSQEVINIELEETEGSRVASGPAAFASAQENANYARLCRLLVEVGCAALRDTFDSIHPPASLHVALSGHSVFSTLQSLRKKRVLNPLQWGKLFPAVASTVSSANFDVTLLMVLLRNICGLSPPVSTGNWNKLPPDSDNSTEANIVRIKCYRNNVYGHATNASVDNATFNVLWQKISTAILALGSGHGTDISQLKAECMDPATEVHYQRLLSDLKKDDDILKEMLGTSCDDIGEIIGKQQKTNNELEEKKGSQEIANNELEETKGVCSDLQSRSSLNASWQGSNEIQERTNEQLRKIKGSQEIANNELEEIKEIQERTNEQLRKIKEMIKQLQPCERKPKEFLKDEQDHFGLVSFINIIRQLYKDREGWLVLFPWYKEFHINFDNIFTRLKFVSRRKERGIKTDDVVDMFQIFQPHEECVQPRRVLIEGNPGMGKTTYCHKIAYDWAKERKGGESFPDVLLVLLLKCKDIRGDLWEAIDDQLLPREVNQEERERFFTFVREHQSKVLLVLDGLDELPQSKLWIYKEIIRGRVLPGCYLVVTARHGVGVRECCDTLLEVEGFTETDAKNFIQKYFSEEEKGLAEEFLNKLDSDTTLQDLTKNPLNTALLCLLYEEFGGKLPNSRTLLYLEMVECMLRRYRLKMDLPGTDQDLTALYQNKLKQLGCVAMEGLHNSSLYFDESTFQGFLSDFSPELEFLSVEAGRSKRRPGRSYGFLHKSFQDFFAALYCSGQLLDGEIPVDSLIGDPRYFDEFQQVLMFTSGMLAQKCESAVKGLIAGMATQVKNNSHLHVALACLNECKREENTLDKEMAQLFGSHLQLQTANCGRLNQQLAALAIETMKTNSVVTELFLIECYIDGTSANALTEVLKQNSTLKALDLSDNVIGTVGADALAKGLKENSTLTELNLCNNAIGEVGADALGKGLKENSALTSLDVSNNAIGEVGADALAKGLRKNSTLTWLDLSNNAIGEIGVDALAKELKENSMLTELDLSNNAIGDVGAGALAKVLKENSTLEWLILSNNAIGDFGADALANGLKENSTLTELDLSNNAIGKVGADALAQGLKENSVLSLLFLSNNAVGEVGADVLAEGLKENSMLTSLDLSNNAVGEFGADALAKGLKENSTLTWLFLSNNAIGEVGADVLAKGLKENSTLTFLKLSDDAIGEVGADALAKGLKENSTLTWLDLSNNAIGEVGANALAKVLKENLTLRFLFLCDNAIGDVGADALGKGLGENLMLTWLDLSDNAIGDVGADALARGLKENSMLTSLDLSNNAIGKVGADALAKGLKENSTLRIMHLSGNLIDNFVDAVEDALKENRKFKKA